MRRLCAFVVAAVAAASLMSCSLFKTYAEVESSTRWSGDFNGRTVDGEGNEKLELGTGNRVMCAAVQKQTREGFLTLRVESDVKTTTAEFGVVVACSDGY